MYTSARSTREVSTSEESCLSFCVKLRDASASALVSRVAAFCSTSDEVGLCGLASPSTLMLLEVSTPLPECWLWWWAVQSFFLGGVMS